MSYKPRYLIAALALAGCASQDPILPGVRENILYSEKIAVLDKKIEDIGRKLDQSACATVDSKNVVRIGDKKIFSGFPTEAKIGIHKQAACFGGYIYAGLSTGELVKIDKSTGELVWTSDIFARNKPLVVTPFMDIIATPVFYDGFIYVGGMGGAFCKIKDSDGSSVWCVPVNTHAIIHSTSNFNFVLSDEKYLYAIAQDGKVFWRSALSNTNAVVDGDCVGNISLLDGKECQR